MRIIFSWSLGHVLSIANFLLAVLFVSFILRSKRPPGNTLAWLIFVLVAPYIGIPFYIFLTGRKFQTRLQKKKALYEANPSGVSKWEGAVEKLLAGSGVPPPRPSQKARLLTAGEEAYGKITELIASARRRIHLTTFIFARDPVGDSLIRLLEKKAEEGVSVCLLLDSFGSLWAPRPSFKRLREKGGQVVYFNPVLHLPFRGRANLRNHRKFLIVDSRRAILGGMNFAREYMGPNPDPQRWTDLSLEMEGSGVGDLESVFSEDWRFATGKDPGLDSAEGDEPPGDCQLQVVASGPDVRWDPLYDCLLSMIFQASRRVWIATPYFIPDEALGKALELAARRGVEVRLLIPRKSNHGLADLARGTYLRQILKSGGRVELAEKMLHAKAFLVDEKYALLGSANFDMRSLLYNYEVGLLIRPGEPLSALERWFEGQFQAAGKSDFRVNYLRDLAEGVGRVLGPLI
jgi:cardiolipin synthase A/B